MEHSGWLMTSEILHHLEFLFSNEQQVTSVIETFMTNDCDNKNVQEIEESEIPYAPETLVGSYDTLSK